MPTPLPGHLGRDLTDVDRAQIRALSRAGYEVAQLSKLYLRNPRAIKRARDNKLKNKADLSKDPELLDDTFLGYLKGGDEASLREYIRARVTGTVSPATIATGSITTGRRKARRSPSPDVDSEEDAYRESASDDYTPPPTKKSRQSVTVRLACRLTERK